MECSNLVVEHIFNNIFVTDFYIVSHIISCLKLYPQSSTCLRLPSINLKIFIWYTIYMSHIISCLSKKNHLILHIILNTNETLIIFSYYTDKIINISFSILYHLQLT